MYVVLQWKTETVVMVQAASVLSAILIKPSFFSKSCVTTEITLNDVLVGITIHWTDVQQSTCISGCKKYGQLNC